VHLAKQYLDFEPGIHFSLAQMQSGITGINTVRIYSPAKQVIDHDLQGIFIRKFIPERTDVPNEYSPYPQHMPLDMQIRVGCIIGKDYPQPIVNHRVAYRAAQGKIFAVRQTEFAVTEARRVFVKHGSRKRRDPVPKVKKANQSTSMQMTLFDESDSQGILDNPFKEGERCRR